jgi:hypothetical protein
MDHGGELYKFEPGVLMIADEDTRNPLKHYPLFLYNSMSALLKMNPMRYAAIGSSRGKHI